MSRRRFARRTGGFSSVSVFQVLSRALQAQEREEISSGLSAELSIREIAMRLGRAASTGNREMRRNGDKRFYRAANADARAWRTVHRPRPCLLAPPAIA